MRTLEQKKNSIGAAKRRLMGCNIPYRPDGRISVGEVADLLKKNPTFIDDFVTYLTPTEYVKQVFERFGALSRVLYQIQIHPNVDDETFEKASRYSDYAIEALRNCRYKKLIGMLREATEQLVVLGHL